MANLKRNRHENETRTMVDSDEEKDSYPFGLKLYLEKEELAKLGIGGKQVGDECVFTAVSVVTNISKEPGEVGGEMSMTLQITDMEMKSGDIPIVDRLYGDVYNPKG